MILITVKLYYLIQMIKSKINKIVKKPTRENKYCLNKQQLNQQKFSKNSMITRGIKEGDITVLEFAPTCCNCCVCGDTGVDTKPLSWLASSSATDSLRLPELNTEEFTELVLQNSQQLPENKISRETERDIAYQETLFTKLGLISTTAAMAMLFCPGVIATTTRYDSDICVLTVAGPDARYRLDRGRLVDNGGRAEDCTRT
ncbi:hypothetical protein AGLY_014511 [Aphis glycines]|uniref:Uncharacterized protein n=1 Tax=Aphis glycines TaxID=307491 RepID=A0A6G0T5C3_APHGL|nr:hypothetical protein AGLY_014511 [Aphis glycines]